MQEALSLVWTEVSQLHFACSYITSLTESPGIFISQVFNMKEIQKLIFSIFTMQTQEDPLE